MAVFVWKQELDPAFPLAVLEYRTGDGEDRMHWHDHLEIALVLADAVASSSATASCRPNRATSSSSTTRSRTWRSAPVAAPPPPGALSARAVAGPAAGRSTLGYLAPFRGDGRAPRRAGWPHDRARRGSCPRPRELRRIGTATIRPIATSSTPASGGSWGWSSAPRLRAGAAARSAGDRREQIRPVLAYIDRHCRESITLHDVAGVVHVSPSRVRHVFKDVTGVGFKEYVTNVRVAEAKRLLLGDDLVVADIARAVGYTNLNQFYRVFYRSSAMSPAEYRRYYALSRADDRDRDAAPGAEIGDGAVPPGRASCRAERRAGHRAGAGCTTPRRSGRGCRILCGSGRTPQSLSRPSPDRTRRRTRSPTARPRLAGPVRQPGLAPARGRRVRPRRPRGGRPAGDSRRVGRPRRGRDGRLRSAHGRPSGRRPRSPGDRSRLVTLAAAGLASPSSPARRRRLHAGHGRPRPRREGRPRDRRGGLVERPSRRRLDHRLGDVADRGLGLAVVGGAGAAAPASPPRPRSLCWRSSCSSSWSGHRPLDRLDAPVRGGPWQRDEIAAGPPRRGQARTVASRDRRCAPPPWALVGLARRPGARPAGPPCARRPRLPRRVRPAPRAVTTTALVGLVALGSGGLSPRRRDRRARGRPSSCRGSCAPTAGTATASTRASSLSPSRWAGWSRARWADPGDPGRRRPPRGRPRGDPRPQRRRRGRSRWPGSSPAGSTGSPNGAGASWC